MATVKAHPEIRPAIYYQLFQSGRKKCPERTGLLLGTERHWSHCGERQKLSRDPAPPASSLVRGFGGGGAKGRFNPTRDPNHVSQEAAIKQGCRTKLKQAQVLAMLHSKQGATIATITEATGWQPHSVLGFLTAVVRKKLGQTLVSEKTGEERVYRVVASDIPPKRKSRGRKVA